MREFADAIAELVQSARDAPWIKIGVVTAFSGGVVTATIDGASITNIRRDNSYTTPANGDVAYFAVIRGSRSVQYIAINKIV